MKKIFNLFYLLVLLTSIYSCSGYKPIFKSSNLEFNIADYSIQGDLKLGKQIYSKLYNLSQSNEKNLETKDIYIAINTSINKTATAKNSTGKILGYRIGLSTAVTIKNLMTGNEILNKKFSYSSTYKTQDQFYQTKKLENKSIENLINKTYQEILIQLSKNN